MIRDEEKTKEQLIEELEELRERITELTLLDKTLTVLARELDLPALIHTVVKVIAETFGYDLVSFYLLQGKTLVLQDQVGYDELLTRVPTTQGITGQVVHTGKPLLLKDARTDPAFSGAIDRIVSKVCVPIVDQNQVVGILNVESRDGTTLSEVDLRLMTMLSEHLSIAIGRARLYAEARRNEEKYRTLIDQANDAIYLIYGNRFEIVNRRFEELFGVSQEDANAPGFVFTNIVAPKSRKLMIERAKMERANRNNDSPKVSPVYEFTALDKDGNEIEVELTVSYPTYKGGLATQGVLRDITERKRTEAERATMQAQMFQSAKLASVGELAAGVAHEINNPIFAIREYADLILEDTPKDHPSYRMLEIIIKEANRIANIVRNLLKFSRPSETQFGPVQLGEVWELVYNLIGQSFHKRNIRLKVDIPDDLPPVKARGQQLQQVLLNLATNARDALDEKFPRGRNHSKKCITIKARLVEDSSALILPNGENPGKAVRLTVRDEGVGISPKDRELLFTPFFTTKRPKGGTGLGLSISHKIIEDHHGRIEVESEPGEFTEFIVTLPVANDQIL